MSLQEVTPEQDILAEAMKCIHDDNLQILINKIRDLKTKIVAIEKNPSYRDPHRNTCKI